MFYKIVHKLVELPLPDNIYSFRSTRGNELKFICHKPEHFSLGERAGKS